MVVDQTARLSRAREIVNAVNFPTVTMPAGGVSRRNRHSNVPNMLGQISTTVRGRAENPTHGQQVAWRHAYTLVDVDRAVTPPVEQALCAIDGVLAVRYLPQAE